MDSKILMNVNETIGIDDEVYFRQVTSFHSSWFLRLDPQKIIYIPFEIQKVIMNIDRIEKQELCTTMRLCVLLDYVIIVSESDDSKRIR